MSNEHNPIAQLISQIQQKWNSEVTPHAHLKVVRWLIIPEQARLYEGFLKLESTAFGHLPDMVIVLLTAVTSKEKHSENLIKDWIEAFSKDQKTIESMVEKHPDFSWDVDGFEERLTENTKENDLLLIEMAKSFQEALPEKDRDLTLALFPYSVEDTKDYGAWVNKLMNLGLPEKVRFMMFDYSDERFFDTLLKKHEDISKSLSVPLDLQGAISKIVNSGNPNDPDVQFRKCTAKMSKCANNGNLTKLHEWGKKGLEITQRTGLKSFYASAHIIYAGMLFGFKEFEEIDNLLLRGLAIAKQGLQMGDDACKPLLIQAYGFQASSKQLQKKREDAANLFCKQADTALEYGFSQQPLTAWWMAYSVIKKVDKDQYKELVAKAYDYGNQQDKESLKSTCMTFIAADYYNILDQDSQYDDCKKVDEFMIEVDGEDWREQIEARKKEMEKRKLSLRNWF